jgi:HAD superfamily hydrolase (TIGR01509 family)
MNAHKVDTVFLDAGGVLCHPSWTRVADALVRHGAVVTASKLASAEQKATRDIDDATVVGTTDDRARGWLYFNLVLQHAGVAQNEGTDAALAELREYHRLDNLWEHVEPDVAPALAALRDRGLRLVVVSNANGRLRHLFDRVDLTKWFDHVLDSHEWGVEKPNPRLFQIALEQSRAAASSTVHVGDLYHVDVMGARAAGLREGVLFDMAGLYDDVDCPRVASLSDLVEWIDTPSGNQTRNRVP